MAKSEVGSNIAQNDPKWSLIIISIDILVQFSQEIDQNWKMAKSEVGSNIAPNDPKWSLIVISIDILVQFSQEVDQNWKMVKKVKSVRTLPRMTPNGP